MTNHYIETLGVAKCREILKGAPEGAVNWWEYRGCYAKETTSHGFADPFIGSEERTFTPIFMDGEWTVHRSGGYPNLISLSSIKKYLELHDTDDFTHLENHISPMTIVEENLQEQFQEANEAGEGR